MDFDACMRIEFRIVNRVLKGSDFYEGVRAVIIDKDMTIRDVGGTYDLDHSANLNLLLELASE